MKILYIANSRLPTDNAHGVQIMKTCEALANAGAEVTLVRPWRINRLKGDPFDFYNIKRNFKIVTLPVIDTLMFGPIGFWIQNIKFGSLVYLWLFFKTYDVVYSRDELPLYMASFAAKKCIWESHTGRYNGLIARLLKRIALLVVITRGGSDFYAEKGFPKEQIHVAPDAVSPEDFDHPQSKRDSRTRLGLPFDKKLAMYIGKLEAWKGAETLCAASEFLPHDVRVAVIGGELNEMVELKQKYPKVIFLGWKPYAELPDNQAAGDVLVLPNSAKSEISMHFTSPLKLFTYMASGIPIVASDVPSIREILTEETAFWFKPDDAKDLADKIALALSSSDSHATAQAAREEVKKYSWDVRARNIVAKL